MVIVIGIVVAEMGRNDEGLGGFRKIGFFLWEGLILSFRNFVIRKN